MLNCYGKMFESHNISWHPNSHSTTSNPLIRVDPTIKAVVTPGEDKMLRENNNLEREREREMSYAKILVGNCGGGRPFACAAVRSRRSPEEGKGLVGTAPELQSEGRPAIHPHPTSP